MTGEELDEDTIMSLFEAARWAPSWYNNQPGDSYMLRETAYIGINFLICQQNPTKFGQKMLLC